MRFNDRAMALAGIPDLPPDAFKKEGGKIKLHGGGPSAPESTTSTTTTIPEYAKPYVERMLGRAEATTQRPYQAFGGQRIAEFDPMQKQAFSEASALQPASQIGAGSQLAGAAGIGALTAGQRYAMGATDPGVTRSYMSPYIQNALAPQLDEARRQSEISGQQMAGQAVKAGAFGGSRFGIMEAERLRNLGQQQQQIYGTGMENAFRNAQQAQQFGSTLGLQGLGQAGSLAGTLGQLGQTEFGQQQARIQGLASAGAQQQALDQKALDQSYQDFLTQRGYEQQQLAYMSDMLRGLPLTQQTQQVYQAPPSMVSQLGGLGMAAYGMFGGQNPMIKMAEGGEVKHDDKPAGLAELLVFEIDKD